jgi:hypothetical protein
MFFRLFYCSDQLCLQLAFGTTTDQAHMFETMKIAHPTSHSLIFTPCDLIVKSKNMPGKARNKINKNSTRSKRLKLTHNLGH